jgi:hypothetical protein
VDLKSIKSMILWCNDLLCWDETGTGVVGTESKSLKGRAIAQAVSRRLPTVAARVQTRVWSCGIL